MNGLSMSIVWCAVQVTLFLVLAAPVYLLARRLHPRAGTVAALGSLMAVVALSLLAGSSWPRWEWKRKADGAALPGRRGWKWRSPSRGALSRQAARRASLVRNRTQR